MPYQTITFIAATFAVFTASSAAFAQPHIAASTPAMNGVATKLSSIILKFNESLAQAPAIALTMTSMPGMAHHTPMKVSGFKVMMSSDGLTTTLALPRALPPGTYNLAWEAKSTSGEAQGMIAFTAR